MSGSGHERQDEGVELSLAKPRIHRSWIGDYYTPRNERFYDRVFDFILKKLGAEAGTTFLDAGCGDCAHSIRLAHRGYRVVAVDFSESVLRMASDRIEAEGLEAQIDLRRENLLSSSFEDGTFQYALCWGVLMHIPDVERAISELGRVVRAGGTLVVSEANMHSLQARLLRAIRPLTGKRAGERRKTPAGIEYWAETPEGRLLTREANVRWLVDQLQGQGFVLKHRFAGQLSELYTRSALRMLRGFFHSLNDFWFGVARSVAGPAFGNILILEKGAVTSESG